MRRILILLVVAALFGCSDDDGDKKDLGADITIGPDSCCGEAGAKETAPTETSPTETAPTEGGADMANPCDACKSDEVCVQMFDGTCQTGPPSCVKVSTDCKSKVGTAGSPCASECEMEYCTASPYQCQNQVPCGTEAKGVEVYCYGP